MRALWRTRPLDGRKGDFGRVLVCGGSNVYSGAPALNALAALRAGADLAIVVAPRRAADIIATMAPDLITVPCDTDWPDPGQVRAWNVDAFIVGGGVERTTGAHDALRRIIAESGAPMVIDAEALHAIAGHPEILLGKRALLTPHAGEAKLLGGASAADIARRYGCAVIIKGARDDISDGERTHSDDAGSPFMTKGGYGDLLAGAAGALLARGASPYAAARGAAWLVGTAGARAAARPLPRDRHALHRGYGNLRHHGLSEELTPGLYGHPWEIGDSARRCTRSSLVRASPATYSGGKSEPLPAFASICKIQPLNVAYPPSLAAARYPASSSGLTCNVTTWFVRKHVQARY